MIALCPEQDSNLHILGTLVPETSASTNSAIRAITRKKTQILTYDSGGANLT